MARTQTPQQAPAAGDGAEGYTGCNAARPLSERHNGCMRTDSMRITGIGLIYTCDDIKTNKTRSNFLSFYLYTAKRRNYNEALCLRLRLLIITLSSPFLENGRII